jgi:succinate dehydrogenase / fumarate reductase membrane anchor subunit
MKYDKTSIATPLARARGLGAAHDGTHHFIWQRITALALIPLLLWLVASLACKTGADYYEFTAWAANPPVALALILTLTAMFWHASLGLQVVIEDYVHCAWVKYTSLILMKLTCFVLATAGIFSVILIAVQQS